MDALIAEAVLRTVRMLTLITGALVLVDSIGILVRPRETPPHKPKWAATSWCIVSGSAALVTGYLLTHSDGLAGENQQVAIWLLYAGLATGFTCRAISRAHRPLFTVLAVIGMSIAGMTFAVWDMVR